MKAWLQEIDCVRDLEEGLLRLELDMGRDGPLKDFIHLFGDEMIDTDTNVAMTCD